jgi:hypothetical protein
MKEIMDFELCKKEHRNIFISDYINIIIMKTETRIRRWGRSFGVVLPMEKVKAEGLKENDVVSLLILKKANPLKETFGTIKFKKSTQQMLKESDREAWDE